MGQVFVRLEDSHILQAIRQGMLLAIPVFITGSMALVLLGLPIASYQAFLANFLGGQVVRFLTFVHHATLDMLSLVLLLTISYSYGKLSGIRQRASVPVASLCAYLAFAGAAGENALEIFQVSWLFSALIISILSAAIYVQLNRWWVNRRKYRSGGADADFSDAMSAVYPFVIVVAAFVLLRMAMEAWLGDTNLQNQVSILLSRMFQNFGRNLGSGLLFIFLLHLMWFFGIHGGNVLDYVAQDLFASGMAANAACLAVGQAPTELFTKTFFDTMVLMGGCGSLLCLVIAIFVGCKRRNQRALARAGIVPALFNINEIMVFGLPVVLNPVMLVPFLLTPMVLTLTSAAAMALGWVPFTTADVTWTTPIFLSGYVATGSIAGSLLQLFNLAVGVAIYLPFIRLGERRHANQFKRRVGELVQEVRRCESLGEEPSLLDRGDELGSVAKTLAADLRYALRNRELQLYYQPQVHCHGHIAGAEGLLRWSHEEAGLIYPPLAIALAREAGFLDDLGDEVLRRACRDIEEMNRMFPDTREISINVSAHQLNNPHFFQEVVRQVKEHHLPPGQLGLEITEQVALSGSKAMIEQLYALRDLGVQLLMDDFGMGHSSLLYLQNNSFDWVKLDGSLVRDLLQNQRCGDIIASIVQLGKSMHFEVLAEYVETQAQRDRLAALGCLLYQGYYYSPALPLSEWLAFQVPESTQGGNCHEG